MAVALAATCVVVPASAAARPELRPLDVQADRTYVPGEAIVRFEPGTSAADRRDARLEAGVAFDDALGLPRAEAVEVDGSVSAAVRRLEQQPGVAYAQPNYRYETLAVEPPDDPFFGQLWGLSDPALPSPGVSVLEAWEDREGVDQVKGAGQVIAVLDTGVDQTHPDIEGNLWINPDPDPIAEDLHGYDFVDDDGDPEDYEFHGTHVAGTAAAIADNGEGIAGVAPQAQIMAVRVLDGDGTGSTAEIADGIAYAVENDADVINMSLGGPAGGDQATEDAIELAGVKDVVVVAAAGNEGVNNDVKPHTPCALPQANLICVAALNRTTGGLASFSNYGAESVDIAAPGTTILSAKTDYGVPVFSDDFESDFGSIWDTAASSGGIEWGVESLNGSNVASDSPGVGQDYALDAVSALLTVGAVDLTGERGCRLHFKTMYEIEEDFDAFEAGAFSEAPKFDLREFDGTSSGFPNNLVSEEASISELDGQSTVHPVFRINSDEIEQRDGAYVDDVQLICRDDEYDVSNYAGSSGTSMATPHVAGVVALVRAAAPSLNAVQAIDAVLTGASAIPTPSATRRTATEGIADACQAIAVATGADFAVECPGSSENVVPPPVVPPPLVPPSPPSATPPPSGGNPPPVLDRRSPRTFIRQRPRRVVRVRTNRARVVFTFRADEGNVTFACRVDRGLFRPCRSRLVRRLRSGAHLVQVAARDAAGNVDPTPARYRFRVERLD